MVCSLDTAPLSDRARIVLIRMAWATLDKPSDKQAAAEYWRGWDWLGIPWADGRDAKAVEQIVRRAIAELVLKGYIKPTLSAHTGQRQRYLITVDY